MRIEQLLKRIESRGRQLLTWLIAPTFVVASSSSIREQLLETVSNSLNLALYRFWGVPAVAPEDRAQAIAGS